MGTYSPPDQTAYLIEMNLPGSRASWWTGAGFTSDELAAARFMRREDAGHAMMILDKLHGADFMRVTEYTFHLKSSEGNWYETFTRGI